MKKVIIVLVAFAVGFFGFKYFFGMFNSKKEVKKNLKVLENVN